MVLPLPSHCLIEQNTLASSSSNSDSSSTPTPASAFRACDHCMPGSCVCVRVAMYICLCMCVCKRRQWNEWRLCILNSCFVVLVFVVVARFLFLLSFVFFYNSCQSRNNDDDDVDVDADDSSNDNASSGQLLYRLHMPLCLPHPLAYSPRFLQAILPLANWSLAQVAGIGHKV